MKLAKVEKRFSDAGPGFNHAAAETVFKAVMECPDNESAAFFTRALVLDVMGRDIVRHGEFLSKAMRAADEDRIAKVKDALARQYVAKRLKGEDVAEIAKAAEYIGLISKDVYDFQERSKNAKKQRRGQGGRFVAENKKVEYDNKAPVDEHVFNRVYGTKMPYKHGPGSKKAGENLSDRERRNWQLAYQQAQDLMGPYADLEGTLLHLRYGANEYQVRPNELASHLQGNRRPTSMAVSVDDRFDTPGPYNFYQMGAGLGAPRAGARVQGTIQSGRDWEKTGLNPDRLRRFNDANEQFDAGAAYQPGGRLFQRLGNGSQLLEDTLGDNAPEKLKAALAAGRFIGDYGPEAQRAIGPSVQRNAYRYRGVERQPDQRITSIFNSINGSDQLKNASVADKVRFALTPNQRDNRGKDVITPAVKYFRDRLPKANLNTLQTASGNIPPSEGVLVDKNSKVITQAVGYGDDWYLPFNLKNVGRMKGGSYIRTRTFGGPTTEDIYTGLMSGANQLTVISHNGVYTVEFDENFKGGRRYNDKAARMVTRYGQILDAVKSEKVVLDLMDPARKREIRQEAARNVRDPDNPTQIDAEVRRLTNAERMHPKLSAVRSDEVKQDVLNQYADRISTKSRDLSAGDLRGYALTRYAADARSKGVDSGEAYETGLQSLNDKLSTDDGLIDHFGLQEQYEGAREREVNKIRRDLSPLALNGRGYELALESLREQFPYYIKQPTFREWDEISGSKDSGYIKPKHIRPEGALAGYFDGSIVGQPGKNGKVTADSVATGRFREGQTQYQRSQRDNNPTEVADTRSGNGVGLRSSESPNARPSESSGRAPIPALVRDEADRDLAQNLRSVAEANRNEMAWLFDGNPGNGSEEQKNLARILNMSDDDIDAAIDASPDRFNKDVQRAARHMGNYNSTLKDGIDQKKVDVSRRRGAPPEARDVPTDVSSMLRRPHDEYKLGRKFEPEYPHSREDILRDYKEDGDIQRAGLPDLDSDDFDSTLNQKLSGTNALYREIAVDRRGRYSDQYKRDLDSQIQGMVKASHLKRRLKEADEDAAARAVVSPDDGPDIERERTVVVMPGPGESAQDAIARFQGGNQTTAPQLPRGMTNAEVEAEWERIAGLPVAEQHRQRQALTNRLLRGNE